MLGQDGDGRDDGHHTFLGVGGARQRERGASQQVARFHGRSFDGLCYGDILPPRTAGRCYRL
jgi:hypothetical protein